MTRIDTLKPWFVNLSITGGWAIFWTIVAIAVPTLIRTSVQGFVVGCGTVTFIPAVLLSAIFLGWRYATIVALASAVIADTLFLGHDHLLLEGACDIYGVGAFLVASFLIIGAVEVIRSAIDINQAGARPSERSGGIVFSLEEGQAWASWYGQGSPVRLGPEKEVAEMMEDFLAQMELAKRLCGNK
jgi:hypothetical protein